MYFCVCNAISDKNLKETIKENHNGCVKVFAKEIKKSGGCCICLKTIKKDYPDLYQEKCIDKKCCCDII